MRFKRDKIVYQFFSQFSTIISVESIQDIYTATRRFILGEFTGYINGTIFRQMKNYVRFDSKTVEGLFAFRIVLFTFEHRGIYNRLSVYSPPLKKTWDGSYQNIGSVAVLKFETSFLGKRRLQRVGDLIVLDTTVNIKRTSHSSLCFRCALRDKIVIIEIRVDRMPSSRPLVPTIRKRSYCSKRNCCSAICFRPSYSFWCNTRFNHTFCPSFRQLYPVLAYDSLT